MRFHAATLIGPARKPSLTYRSYRISMAVTQAGLEGIIAAESNICFIDGDLGILSYQGFNIHTLAEHATFEEVIYLLWHGKLPKQSDLDVLKTELIRYRPIPQEVVEFLGKVPKGTPMDVLRT